MSLLSKLPLNQISKKFILPVYHIVSDEDIKHVSSLFSYRSVKQFREDLDCFNKYYHPVDLKTLVNSVRTSNAIRRNAFFLSFDDGFKEVYEIIVPILKEKGIPATFFLNSSTIDNRSLIFRHKASLLIEKLNNKNLSRNILTEIQLFCSLPSNDPSYIKKYIYSIEYEDKIILDKLASILNLDFVEYLEKNKPYLNSNQVKKILEEGFSIGAHSIDHPHYSKLSLQDQVKQTKDSLDFLEKNFGLKYKAFAFPFNDQNVKIEYFKEVHEVQKLVDISFGTAGIVKDSYCRNLQRMFMEGTNFPAKHIINKEYLKGIRRVISGKNIIYR